jgi:hypothetical protein
MCLRLDEDVLNAGVRFQTTDRVPVWHGASLRPELHPYVHNLHCFGAIQKKAAPGWSALGAAVLPVIRMVAGVRFDTAHTGVPPKTTQSILAAGNPPVFETTARVHGRLAPAVGEPRSILNGRPHFRPEARLLQVRCGTEPRYCRK